MTPRILLVDDEPHVLSALRRCLHAHFGDALAIDLDHDTEAALALLRTREYDVVLSDLHMPAMTGIEFLSFAAGLQPQAQRLILSASTDFGPVQQAINELGVFRYLIKPWREAELQRHVREALDKAAEERLRQGLAEVGWLQFNPSTPPLR